MFRLLCKKWQSTEHDFHAGSHLAFVAVNCQGPVINIFEKEVKMQNKRTDIQRHRLNLSEESENDNITIAATT
jgi:hypothetical protein